MNKTKRVLSRILVSFCLFMISSLSLQGCGLSDDNSPDGYVESSASEVETEYSKLETEEITTVETFAESTTTEEETVTQTETIEADVVETTSTQVVSLDNIPEYTSSPYVVVNDNVPYFTDSDLTTTSFEYYSELDALGRCGVAFACIGQDIMPTEPRGEIGSIKPTGWHTVKYDIVDGNYLYNRCHLIAYQLAGENANEKNLITGTRYLNTEGMLPFEEMVADYVNETDNHVLYRVTPMFDGDNLVASGVLMEALSIEDDGDGIEFNVYCYNVQPGVEIDYATGDSVLAAEVEEETIVAEDTTAAEETTTVEETTNIVSDDETTVSTADYILNTNTKKFHYPWCSSVSDMAEKNKLEYTGDREDVIDMGYEPCKRCNP